MISIRLPECSSGTYLQATKPLALCMRESCDCMFVKPSVRSPNINGTCVQWNSRRSTSCKKIGLRLDAFPGGVIAVGHREMHRLLRRGDETYWGIENYMDSEAGGGSFKREPISYLERSQFASLNKL